MTFLRILVRFTFSFLFLFVVFLIVHYFISISKYKREKIAKKETIKSILETSAIGAIIITIVNIIFRWLHMLIVELTQFIKSGKWNVQVYINGEYKSAIDFIVKKFEVYNYNNSKLTRSYLG